jgi:signal transduction histidine kinase
MAPITALAFLFGGLALLAQSQKPEVRTHAVSARYRLRTVALSCAAVMCALGLLRLVELALDRASLVDSVIAAREAQGPLEAMTPLAALTAVAAGLALLLNARDGGSRATEGAALTVVLVGLLGLSHYAYGGLALSSLAELSLLTALSFVVLGAGTLLSRREGALVALLSSDGAGGLIARRLLPWAMLMPFGLGFTCLRGYEAGWFGLEAAFGVFALSNVIVFGAIAWATAAALEKTDAQRRDLEKRTEAQLARLGLLTEITRSADERKDLSRILNVTVSSLEVALPVDFAVLFRRQVPDQELVVAAVGTRSEAMASKLAIPERARIGVDANGFGRALQGQLTYDPDLENVDGPFPRRLAEVGLRALVVIPLVVENEVFGVLLTARRAPESFSREEREFLNQLSHHLGLAAHNAELFEALRQAYDDLRQTQEFVVNQERLRALGHMASGIAHDINNAISPIGLYVDSLLETETTLSASARDYLEIIGRSITDVGATVGRLREFYREPDSERAAIAVQLNQLVTQVINLTKARWSDMPQQRGVVIRVRAELEEALPPVLGIESELREALTNLIFNAVDAMPNGGTLTVRTRRIGGVALLPEAILEVVDTGVGMDAETKRRCLEPFFTTKGDRGTGLGLSMVYGILQRHAATVEFESATGLGTTVRLTFPVPDTLAEATLLSERPAGFRLRILVVDDDPLITRSLEDTLEPEGHRVTAAEGGQAGIDAFRESLGGPDPYSVVITDLGMPHVDGRRVASAIKDMSPTTPIIMLTGWGQRAFEGSEWPPCVDIVLEKPPKLRILRRVFAQLVPEATGSH